MNKRLLVLLTSLMLVLGLAQTCQAKNYKAIRENALAREYEKIEYNQGDIRWFNVQIEDIMGNTGTIYSTGCGNCASASFVSMVYSRLVGKPVYIDPAKFTKVAGGKYGSFFICPTISVMLGGGEYDFFWWDTFSKKRKLIFEEIDKSLALGVPVLIEDYPGGFTGTSVGHYVLIWKKQGKRYYFCDSSGRISNAKLKKKQMNSNFRAYFYHTYFSWTKKDVKALCKAVKKYTGVNVKAK